MVLLRSSLRYSTRSAVGISFSVATNSSMVTAVLVVIKFFFAKRGISSTNVTRYVVELRKIVRVCIYRHAAKSIFLRVRLEEQTLEKSEQREGREWKERKGEKIWEVLVKAPLRDLTWRWRTDSAVSQSGGSVCHSQVASKVALCLGEVDYDFSQVC